MSGYHSATPTCAWCGDPDVGARYAYLADPRHPDICSCCMETAERKAQELRELLDEGAPGLLEVVEPDTVGYWIGEGWSVPAIARILLGLPDADSVEG